MKKPKNKFLIILMIMIFLISLSFSASATDYVFQPDATNGTDTSIIGGANSGNNFGTADLTILGSGDAHRTLFNWGFACDSIPVGETISNVTLFLEVSQYNVRLQSVRLMNHSWSEDSVTWDNCGAGGCEGWYNTLYNISFTDTVIGTGNNSVAINTTWFTDECDKSKDDRFGFIMIGQGGGDTTIFRSSDYATASLRPSLHITTKPDETAPEVTGSSATVNQDKIDIRANVTDEYTISYVKVEIETPSATKTNYTMSFLSGDEYNYTYTATENGQYSFKIFTEDEFGNNNGGISLECPSELCVNDEDLILYLPMDDASGDILDTKQSTTLPAFDFNYTGDGYQTACGEGQCLNFDGSDVMVNSQIGDYLLGVGNGMTVAFYVEIATSGQNYYILDSRYYNAIDSDDYGIAILNNAGTLHFAFFNGEDGPGVNIYYGTTPTSSYYFFETHPTNVSVYKNNTFGASSVVGSPNFLAFANGTKDCWIIGAGGWGCTGSYSEFLLGNLASFSVWNRTLTVVERADYITNQISIGTNIAQGTFSVTEVDETAPEVTGSSATVNQDKIDIRANVTDESTISYVKVEIEEPDTTKTNFTMPFLTVNEYNYTFTATQQGTHNYVIYAEDEHGNNNAGDDVDGQGSFVPVLDQVPPEFTNQVKNTTPYYNEYVEMNITITDLNPHYYKFFWNDTGSFVNDTAQTYTSGQTVSTVKQVTTAHQNICWGYWANDTLGYSNTSNLGCFTVQNTAPNTPIILSPYDEEISATRKIEFYSTDADADSLTYQIYINDSLNITTSTNITVWNGSDGYYELKISAYDNYDYSSNTSAIQFTLDQNAPLFSNQEKNETPNINEYVRMNITITDVEDSYKFFWNDTGSFVNDTAQTYTSGQAVSTVKQVTTAHQNICWGYWANDTVGNAASSSLDCFTVANTAPIIVINSPQTGQHSDTNLTVDYTPSDEDSDSLTCRLYINNTLDVTNSTITLDTNNYLISTVMTTQADYSWYLNCSDAYEYTTTVARIYTLDIEPPIINWYKPLPPTTIYTNNNIYQLNASSEDPYLDAVNTTGYHFGNITYTNFTGNITNKTIFWSVDIIDFDAIGGEGNYSFEVCARDTFAESPIINDTAIFTKKNANETVFQLPNGNNVTREVVIKDAANNKLSSAFVNLSTVEEWVDSGRHYKTSWFMTNFNSSNTFEIVMNYVGDDLELLQDRGVNRIVDKDRNYYWSFTDLEEAGFEMSYEWHPEEYKIEVRLQQGDYTPNGDLWELDPITGGLNTECLNSSTIVYDITPPLVHSSQAVDLGNNLFNITVNVADNVIVDTVLIEITEPSSTKTNYTMSLLIGDVYNITYFADEVGNHTYRIYANDTIGNLNDTETGLFTASDIDNPNVYSSQVINLGNYIYNITTNTSDNVDVSVVTVEITEPDLTKTNYSMTEGANDIWSYALTTTQIGNHNYSIYSVDTSGNVNGTETGLFNVDDITFPSVHSQQEINLNADGLTWNISVNATDNVGVIEVKVEIEEPSTTKTNYTMSGDEIYHYVLSATEYGTHNYRIYASDAAGNINDTVTDSFVTFDTVYPTFTGQSRNTTPYLNGDVEMTITILDDTPSHYKFFWNTTGSYVNETAQTYTNGTPVTTIKTVPTPHQYICWGYWANDSQDNGITSSLDCFTVQNTIPTKPVITVPSYNDSVVSTNIEYYGTDYDGDVLTYYVYIDDILNVTTSTNITDWQASSGYYKITVETGDGYDISSISDAVYFTLDHDPPIVTVTSFINGSGYNYLPFWINFTTDEPSTCSLNNSYWTLNFSTSTSFSYVDTNSTPNDYYTVMIQCNDSLENTRDNIYSFLLDRDIPTIIHHTINKDNTTEFYAMVVSNQYWMNVTLQDNDYVSSYNATIKKKSDLTLMWSHKNDSINQQTYYVSDLLDITTWENTTYVYDNIVCNTVTCVNEIYEFTIKQPYPPVITVYAPTPSDIDGALGEDINFDIEVTDNNPEDVFTYEWEVDEVYKSSEEDYEYAISVGHIGLIYSVKVTTTDDSPFALTDIEYWNITITSGHHPQYKMGDFNNIVVDGMGTAGATFVDFIDLIIITLVLAAIVTTGYLYFRRRR